MMTKSGSIVILFFLFPCLIFPDDSVVRIEENSEVYEKEKEEEGAAKEEDSLFCRTLENDIKTAGYYELAEWCRSLGLPDNGSSEELKLRIKEYYDLESGSLSEKKGDLFIIRSADAARYFSIDKADEDYINISGGVILEVTESEKKISHKVQTDKLIYNRNKSLMTAEGNVIYTKTIGGKEEKYFGDKLSFNLTDWSGVFFNGISEKSMKMNTNEVKFFYFGEKIIKSGDDVFVMDDASISSSADPGSSYYRLKAGKIWILAPGEWGVKNAVLYVGHVPMFYFPFFFKPGDRLMFRPSLGYQEPTGHFIQTTTYLYGEPSGEEETLSFLAASDSEDRLYKKELNGLYLRRTDVKKEDPGDDSFVKLMFDIYSNLGLYAAIQGDLNRWGVMGPTSFYFGIARTRNIYKGEVSYYTPYYENPDGRFDSCWNRGYFASADLPVRFGLELDTGFDFDILRSDISFDLYSDPYLLRDFENRNENMNWGKILGMGDAVDEAETEYTGTRDRLYWYIHTELDPPVAWASPYISALKLSKLNFSMNWKNKRRDIAGMTGLDPSLDGYIDPSAATDFFFPESTFYYPENFVFPDLSLSISGTLFDRTYNKNISRKTKEKETDKKEEDDDEEKMENDFLDPFPKDKEREDHEEKKEEGLLVPGLRDDIPIKLVSDRNVFSHNIGYTINPNFIIDNRMDDTDVSVPDEIDFDKSYSILRTYGEGKIKYSADFFDTFFSLDDNVIFTGEYKKHSDRSDNISDTLWKSYKDQDHRSSSYKIKNDLDLKTMPFFMFDKISESYFSYSLNVVMMKKEFDRVNGDDKPIYKNYFFEWEKDYFESNEAELYLSYLSFWDQHQTSRIKTVFGPLNREFENENIIRTGILTSSLFFKVKENDDRDLLYEPLQWTERLEYGDSYLQGIYKYELQHDYLSLFEGEGKISFFDDDLYFKQSYNYDFYRGDHDKAVSTFNLWFFNLSYTAERMYPYYYEEGIGWLREDEKEFVPSKLAASFNFSKYGKPVWRNRIRYRTDISAGYKIDLQRFTDNSFTLSLGLEANVYRLFDISFRTVSENNKTYRYSRSLSDKMGEEKLNPVSDLWNSVKFWDKESRYLSSFKLKSLDTEIVHHLGDWDLSYTYSGVPDLSSNSYGIPEWKWKSEFSIMIQWNPVPELKSQLKYKDEKYSM